MIDIADALDYIHSRGIAHGDVKPNNIMVSRAGIPVLTDLDLAAVYQSDVFADSVVGTTPYISPEGWRRVRDERSDLWALGIMLHQMLVGHLPFETTVWPEIEKIVTSRVPLDLSRLRESAPQPVAQIVERCLRKEPSQRYRSAAEIRRDLESVLAYLESEQSEQVAVPLCAGSTILLNVEYKEPGVAGQYREYRIEQELGQGEFSVVYRATDVIGDRPVALKILREERAREEKIRLRFQREAGLLARLDHPNIVRVHNFGRYATDLFIVMEVLEGPTIRDALESGFRFGIEQAVAIVTHVLAGLQEIHAQGAVHRDVKPGNIKLETERAVVMDLGLAHISGGAELTVSGQIFGTPRYMAPEQARGEPVTPQSDLYATGVLLYELLTGTIPHQADNTPSLIFNIALEEPKPITHHRNDLPPPLVSCLDCMLARAAAHRCPSAQSAYKELVESVGLESHDLASVYHQMFQELEQHVGSYAAAA
jgi:serine/threonine protein kinase